MTFPVTLKIFPIVKTWTWRVYTLGDLQRVSRGGFGHGVNGLILKDAKGIAANKFSLRRLEIRTLQLEIIGFQQEPLTTSFARLPTEIWVYRHPMEGTNVGLYIRGCLPAVEDSGHTLSSAKISWHLKAFAPKKLWIGMDTLPQTNIAPENRPFQKKVVFQPSIFRC